MVSRRDPEKSRRVNELMGDLLRLQSLGEQENETRISEIRRAIIVLLEGTVAADGGAACRTSREKAFNDGPDVTLDRVGEREAATRKFGKRVFSGGIPEPLPPETTPRRFSKRMHIGGACGRGGGGGRSRGCATDIRQQLDALTERPDIFSPRNANLRCGLLAMETKGARFPQVSATPRELLERRPYFDVTSTAPERPGPRGGCHPGACRGSAFPPAPPPHAPRGQVPAAINSFPTKLREVRLHDGYLMERSPRSLPTIRDRIEQSYVRCGVQLPAK